ncbi:hypothetical protein A9Q99_23365 [Gammaproteobacteria bacterium 45_16_T64]|nr:hypothetical protein A9Q99_23365 [Gammaproteobacteria bacterium 45_16_T64]
MTRISTKYFFLLVFLFCSASAYSGADSRHADVLKIYDAPYYSLSHSVEVLEDTSNQLTIHDILKPKYQHLFQKNNTDMLNMGITTYAHWLKVRLICIERGENKALLWDRYLEVERSLLNEAELFVPDGKGGYEVIRSDLRQRFKDKDIVHVNSVFPLKLIPGEEVTLYIRVRSVSSSVQFGLSLWRLEGFAEKVAIEEFIYGIFFGAMLMLMMYNLFIYFSVKDRGYLYYVIYLASISLFEFIELGHGVIQGHYLFDLVGKEYVAVFVWIAIWSGLLFFRIFLSTKTLHPRIDFVARFMVRIIVASAILSVFKPGIGAVLWVNNASFVILIFILFGSLYSWIKGNDNAKFFFLAWLTNILGFMTYALMVKGLLPANGITMNCGPIGALVEATMLSFALADRIKRESRNRLRSDQASVNILSSYQSVFNNALEGMYRMTITGDVLTVNRSMSRVMGYESVEQMSENWAGVTNELFSDSNADFEMELRKNEYVREVCLLGTSGKQRWLNHRATLVTDSEGEGVSVEGTLVDVTESVERKKAVIAVEKERVNTEIAKTVARNKSLFLAMMSHQIRTPLTAIVGYSEILRQNNELSFRVEYEAHKKEHIQILRTHSAKLLRLINDILDLSKIEAKQLSIESVGINLESLVSSACKEALRDKEVNIGIEIVYVTKVPNSLHGDPTRLEQVLRYLLDKALALTLSDLRIDIGFDDRFVKFSISTIGNPLSNEEARGLFDIQEALSHSLTGEETELGLPIAKKLTDLMGGGIWIGSNGKIGNQFAFFAGVSYEVDAVWRKASSVQLYKKEKRKANSRVPKLRGLVLLAEDNPVNQQLITSILRRSGVEVIVASDGVEACEFCDNRLPDLVLMDINMPNRNGLEAMEYMQDKGYSMPIFMLSAETDVAEYALAQKLGSRGCLSKPINKDELYEVLAQSLE